MGIELQKVKNLLQDQENISKSCQILKIRYHKHNTSEDAAHANSTLLTLNEGTEWLTTSFQWRITESQRQTEKNNHPRLKVAGHWNEGKSGHTGEISMPNMLLSMGRNKSAYNKHHLSPIYHLQHLL